LKEIDITSFLTPQVLELISANPDILSMLFSSGAKNDNNEYTEEINDLKARLASLEKEIAELKTDTRNISNTSNTSNTSALTTASNNKGKYSVGKIKKTSNSNGQKFTY